MRQVKLVLPVLMLVFATSCASLNPGADPLVVRAEQSITVAWATVDAFVHLDDANRDLWKTKLPEVHSFAEYLRVPVGLPPQQRGISWIQSAVMVKDAYKKTRSSEDKLRLVTALAVLEAAISETQKQLKAAEAAKE